MASDSYTLIHQSQIAATIATLFTVTGGHQYIIKHMTVINNDTVARTFGLYRQGTAAANVITPPNMSIPAGGMAEWDGTMSMDAAETFRAVASVASMLTITIDGDDITL